MRNNSYGMGMERNPSAGMNQWDMGGQMPMQQGLPAFGGGVYYVTYPVYVKMPNWGMQGAGERAPQSNMNSNAWQMQGEMPWGQYPQNMPSLDTMPQNQGGTMPFGFNDPFPESVG